MGRSVDLTGGRFSKDDGLKTKVAALLSQYASGKIGIMDSAREIEAIRLEAIQPLQVQLFGQVLSGIVKLLVQRPVRWLPRMIDDRALQRLESQVDALRTREKDSEALKTYDQVFDRACLLLLQRLISEGAFSTLDYPVSTGKEAVVFHGTTPEGKARALKIYRISNSTFRNIATYIEGDPRFKRVKRATKPTIFAWAQKEYQNLVRMADAGVRVPAPERVEGNVLIMEYIGDETRPAPLLREVDLEDPYSVFNDVVVNMRAIRKARLVHADLSEYNLLFWDGLVVVIDVGQAVPSDHPRAAEWYRRDVTNVARFFHRKGVDVTPAALEKSLGGA